MDIESPATLSDSELLARVKQLVQREREATAALVAHLVEIDDRKLYLEEGCRSLFTYCTQVLHLSEHAAYTRIEACRAVRRCPAVLNGLERGDVHLTAVTLLGPLLTPDNARDLLAAAKHKTKREIEELVARVRPRADVPASVRKVPATRREGSAEESAADSAATAAAAQSATDAAGLPPAKAVTMNSGASSATASEPGAPGPAAVVPLAPERYKVQFTASAAMHAKLRQAQELLRHRIPNGDVAAIFELALNLLVGDLEKKKFAAADRPRKEAASTAGATRRGSRHIPAAVKRAVWQRDEGRCAFVGANQARCSERGELEFDHVWPHADGGSPSVDNIRLLCRRHNQYEAGLFYGRWQDDRARHSA